jgi:hypothetical protein
MARLQYHHQGWTATSTGTYQAHRHSPKFSPGDIGTAIEETRSSGNDFDVGQAPCWALRNAIYRIIPTHAPYVAVLVCYFMYNITLARKVIRHIRRFRPGYRGSLRRLLFLVLPVVPMEILAAFILTEYFRWAQNKQLEAERGYQTYCDSLLVRPIHFQTPLNLLLTM